MNNIDYVTPNMDNVTRLTIVNDKGLILEDWNISALHLDIQDEGRTLKVFYTKE